MLATTKTMEIIAIIITNNPMGEVFFVRTTIQIQLTKITLHAWLPIPPVGKHRM